MAVGQWVLGLRERMNGGGSNESPLPNWKKEIYEGTNRELASLPNDSQYNGER